MKKVIFLILLLALPLSGTAKDLPNPNSGNKEASSSTEALLLYPAHIRNVILKALDYPQTLLGISQLQTKSSQAFRALLSNSPQKMQEKIWELAKYPKLISNLKKGEKNFIKDYPKEVRPIAEELSASSPDLLTKIDALNAQALKDFSNLIQPLPGSAQVAFQTLLQNSDVLTALLKDLNLPTSSNLTEIQAKAKTLATSLKAANSTPTQKIAPQSGDDPKVVAVLQKAEDQFNQANNYEINQDPKPKDAVQVNVNFDPYPYSTLVPGYYTYPFWFGGPFWL